MDCGGASPDSARLPSTLASADRAIRINIVEFQAMGNILRISTILTFCGVRIAPPSAASSTVQRIDSDWIMDTHDVRLTVSSAPDT